MYCANCGNIIPDSAKFCPRCGAPIKNVNPSQISEMNFEDTEDSLTVNQENAPDAGIKNDETRNNKVRPRNLILVIVIVVVVFVIGIIVGLNIGRGSTSDTSVTEAKNVDTETFEEEGLGENADTETFEEEESSANNDSETSNTEEGNEDQSVNSSPFPELEMYSDPEQSDPRTYMSYLYSQEIDGNINGQQVWDYFLSEDTKSRYIESEFVNSQDIYLENYTMLSYMSSSYSEMGDNKYMVTGLSESSTSSGEIITGNTYDYVILENGQYKVYIE